MRFEHRREPLAHRAIFLRRLAASSATGVAIIAASLAIGMLGYHLTEHLSWLDAFVNAAMLLGGEGPIASPQTDGGKLFAGFYALYCGLAVITIAGVIFAPVIHRALHRFHLERTRDAG
ncbi:MAG TPA: hypothetical protein VFB36_15940 [Nevskiaceae bacterium]|nr:hypothetical protein [Nevskiaceae bacterium]